MSRSRSFTSIQTFHTHTQLSHPPPHNFATPTLLTHGSVTHNFVTHNSFTHNSFTHNSFTHNFVAHNSSTHNCHNQLHHTQTHTILSHTHSALLHNLSSTISFILPAFPIPCSRLFCAYWKKLTCGLSGPLIFWLATICHLLIQVPSCP